MNLCVIMCSPNSAALLQRCPQCVPRQIEYIAVNDGAKATNSRSKSKSIEAGKAGSPSVIVDHGAKD